VPRLFHVSGDAGIAVFQPRLSKTFPELGLVVWAVDDSHLVNYLLPRDCPRVTFCAAPTTTESDRRRFSLPDDARVVAIERRWLDEVENAMVHLYELPSGHFQLHDASAGYWLSGETAIPLGVTAVSDLPGEIVRRRAQFRVVERLRTLQEEVVGSTVDFSIIRMRNALV